MYMNVWYLVVDWLLLNSNCCVLYIYCYQCSLSIPSIVYGKQLPSQMIDLIPSPTSGIIQVFAFIRIIVTKRNFHSLSKLIFLGVNFFSACI